MNQLSYYVTKRLIVGSKDSSGTIIHKLNIGMKTFRQSMNGSGIDLMKCIEWKHWPQAAMSEARSWAGFTFLYGWL